MTFEAGFPGTLKVDGTIFEGNVAGRGGIDNTSNFFEAAGCLRCPALVAFATRRASAMRSEAIPQGKASHRAPVAELADAHDSGSCVRNGRGGSTPLRGTQHGLLTVLFYCPHGFLRVGSTFGGTPFFLSFRQFAWLLRHYVCHLFGLYLVEPIEVVIADLCVVVVLNLHTVPNPIRDDVCRHAGLQPVCFATRPESFGQGVRPAFLMI